MDRNELKNVYTFYTLYALHNCTIPIIITSPFNVHWNKKWGSWHLYEVYDGSLIVHCIALYVRIRSFSQRSPKVNRPAKNIKLRWPCGKKDLWFQNAMLRSFDCVIFKNNSGIAQKKALSHTISGSNRTWGRNGWCYCESQRCRTSPVPGKRCTSWFQNFPLQELVRIISKSDMRCYNRRYRRKSDTEFLSSFSYGRFWRAFR